MVDRVKETRIRRMVESGVDMPERSGRGLLDILGVTTNRKREEKQGKVQNVKCNEKANEVKRNTTKLFGENLLNFTS